MDNEKVPEKKNLPPRVGPVYFCPECNSIVDRIPRNPIDKLIGLFFPNVEFGRFRCSGCFWHGRLRIK